MKKVQYDNSIPVVVVGGCHHNTLGVIRSLGWKGLKPILITISNQSKPYITYSRYIGKNFIVPSCAEAYKTLMGMGNSFSNKAVLIICTDSMSSVVDENCESLKNYYYIPGIGGGQDYGITKQRFNDRVRSRNRFLYPKIIDMQHRYDRY